jgi:hypothetical protein
MKILLIVNRYPPDLRVSARRWGNLVEELMNNNINCTVITNGDLQYRNTIGINGETIFYLPFSNTYRPSFYKKSLKYSKAKSVKSKFRNWIPPVLNNKVAFGWAIKIISFRKLCLTLNNSDYIIISYGPLGPLLSGIILSIICRKRLIIDIRDSFEARDGDINIISKYISRLIEKLLLQQAYLRLSVSNTLSEYLEKTYGLPFNPIYNGWVKSDVLTDIRKSNFSRDVYLYYAGSIYSHQIDAFKILLNSLKYFDNISLKIRLLNDFTNKELKSIVDEEKKYINIEILPATNIENVKKEIADSIGVIVLEAVGTKLDYRAGTVTGKLLGLLVSGKPGIAISSKHGEIRINC